MPEQVEIVLVEDSPYDAELTMRALRKNKLVNRVIHVKDGAEALQFLGLGSGPGRSDGPNPRVVLLDLKLPKVDGVEVLRRLRADPKTKTIPVVVLTSSREDQDLKACYDLGVNSYIVKPVDFEQFTAAVTQVGLYWLVLNQPPRG